MALFKGDKDAANQEQEQAASGGDQTVFDDYEGDGLDSITQDAVSTAYLGMVQPGSGPTMTGHAPGSWRNSSTDENYGPSVEVIVLAFKTAWIERSKVSPYETVGRYEPNSIHVDIEPVKPGTRGFPKMTNPATGNKVEELFIYACMKKDSPESGIMYFSPTVGSMKTCKQWNAQLRSQRLPSGRIAPLYAFSWTLYLDLVKNPAKPAEDIAKFVRATRGELLQKELFIEAVRPQLVAAQNVALLAAPETSGDAE